MEHQERRRGAGMGGGKGRKNPSTGPGRGERRPEAGPPTGEKPVPRPAALRRGERAAIIPRRRKESGAGPGARRSEGLRGGEGAGRRGRERGAGPARRPRRKLPRSVTRTGRGRPGQAQRPQPGEGAGKGGPGAQPRLTGAPMAAAASTSRQAATARARPSRAPSNSGRRRLARSRKPSSCPPPAARSLSSPGAARHRRRHRWAESGWRPAPRRGGGSGSRRGRPGDVSALNGDGSPKPTHRRGGGGPAPPATPPSAPALRTRARRGRGSGSPPPRSAASERWQLPSCAAPRAERHGSCSFPSMEGRVAGPGRGSCPWLPPRGRKEAPSVPSSAQGQGTDVVWGSEAAPQLLLFPNRGGGGARSRPLLPPAGPQGGFGGSCRPGRAGPQEVQKAPSPLPLLVSWSPMLHLFNVLNI